MLQRGGGGEVGRALKAPLGGDSVQLPTPSVALPALDTVPGLGQRVPAQGPLPIWGPPCREEKQSKGKRGARAIPRSPGSTAQGTSGARTGWRNLQILEGGRRKPKGGLGFPLPLPLLLLSSFPNRSFPLLRFAVGSP